MKIEIAQHARMSERGSSLLRLIQNNDMPLLDLLVRESVQNSMDASLCGDGYVNLEFNVKHFNSIELNQHLEGIEENLNRKFPSGSYQLLEIRDSNTTGLTGPLHYNQVHDNNFGNLLKLIYEISMPQQQEGAGGSWGLGKTVYFRIGIGLVFYYSRVKDEDGRFSSRLAACLVEDERKSDALINFNDGRPKRGIAWWGQQADDTSTMPLTDEDEIEAIIKIFNIEPYSGDETGTTVIIPYINEEGLLQGILPSHEEGDGKINPHPWWTNSVSEYIKVAQQRWYAPRIMNDKYPYGRWLRSKVNGEGIQAENMLPVFKVVQALYNQTPISRNNKADIDILKGLDVSMQKISLRNMFNEDSCAGFISYIKMTRQQLLMNYPENNPSPFVQINKFDVELEANPPIIAHVRKPGMIVGYETSGQWTEGIPKTSSDEFIIGVFVANSSNTLKNLDQRMSLEEYLRKSEKADHTSWSDWNIGFYKPYIVNKIQRQVKHSISAKYAMKTNEPYTKRNLGLGRALAEILLPPENFGTKATAPRSIGGSIGLGKGSKGYGFKTLDQPKYQNGKLGINFELICGNKLDVFEIQLQILSESGGIEAEKWESEEVIGKEFPMKLDEVVINKIIFEKQSVEFDSQEFYINEHQSESSCENAKLSILKTMKFQTPYGAKIEPIGKKGYKIYGTAYFAGRDDKVQVGLIVVPKEGEEQ